MRYNDYITKLGFTDEDLSILSDIDRTIRNEYSTDFSFARVEYDKGDKAFENYLFSLAKRSKIPVNTLNLYLYLIFAEDSYREYQNLGIEDEVFIKTMTSFSVASHLALSIGQEFGLVQPLYRECYRRELGCRLFTLGRLSFELVESPCDLEIDGKCISKGNLCVSVHIPRFEPFNEDICETSYSLARKFFKKHFGLKQVFFICHSWMLYPWLREVLPETSSILQFHRKFKIYKVDENNKGIAWIFGAGTGLYKEVESIDNLPEDTMLRRAAKHRLKEGKCLGVGHGIRL